MPGQRQASAEIFLEDSHMAEAARRTRQMLVDIQRPGLNQRQASSEIFLKNNRLVEARLRISAELKSIATNSCRFDDEFRSIISSVTQSQAQRRIKLNEMFSTAHQSHFTFSQVAADAARRIQSSFSQEMAAVARQIHVSLSHDAVTATRRVYAELKSSTNAYRFNDELRRVSAAVAQLQTPWKAEMYKAAAAVRGFNASFSQETAAAARQIQAELRRFEKAYHFNAANLGDVAAAARMVNASFSQEAAAAARRCDVEGIREGYYTVNQTEVEEVGAVVSPDVLLIIQEIWQQVVHSETKKVKGINFPQIITVMLLTYGLPPAFSYVILPLLEVLNKLGLLIPLASTGAVLSAVLLILDFYSEKRT